MSFLPSGTEEKVFYKMNAGAPSASKDLADVFSLGFILSNDLKYHERTIYNTLDLLGDIGGL